MPITPETVRASEDIRRREEARLREEENRDRVLIDVYVCPECHDYFGSSGMPRLEDKMTGGRGPNGELQLERAHSRAQCPSCRVVGEAVERVRVSVWVDLPDAVG